jgi:membrane-bound lytic murein transglycosylase A
VNKNQFRISIFFLGALIALTATFFVLSNPMQEADNKTLNPITFDQLADWSGSDKSSALRAFRRSCRQMLEDNRAFSKKPEFGGDYQDWKAVCEAVKSFSEKADQREITEFFESWFLPFEVKDPDIPNGLFTGYFEPKVYGNLKKTDQFSVPLYGRPEDLIRFNEDQQKQTGLGYGRLVNGIPKPYFTRKEIEQGALADKALELLWLKSRADAFFLQIQGSGQIELPNGNIVRLAYAAKTSLPYTAIGAILIKNGELEKKKVSMQSIRQWMDDHPDKAQALMWENKSFVFFRKLENAPAELGPVGAQLVHLTPKTSLAVDRRYWAFGTPVWLNTQITSADQKQQKAWNALMIAQDTGSAIRGYARGDVFWGSGKEAAEIAGSMKARGRMVVLLPKTLVAKLEQ